MVGAKNGHLDMPSSCFLKGDLWVSHAPLLYVLLLPRYVFRAMPAVVHLTGHDLGYPVLRHKWAQIYIGSECPVRRTPLPVSSYR